MGRRLSLPGFPECLTLEMAAKKPHSVTYLRCGFTQRPAVSGDYLMWSRLFTAPRGREALSGRFAGSLDDNDDPEQDGEKAGPKAVLAAPNKLPAEV